MGYISKVKLYNFDLIKKISMERENIKHKIKVGKLHRMTRTFRKRQLITHIFLHIANMTKLMILLLDDNYRIINSCQLQSSKFKNRVT